MEHSGAYRVGLTGGIACGKSTVANLFAALGASIVDTDLLAAKGYDVGFAGVWGLSGDDKRPGHGIRWWFTHVGEQRFWNGEPVGFAGPNDHWHQHNSNGGLCFANQGGTVIGGEQMSAEQCTAIGGNKHALLSNLVMLFYESSQIRGASVVAVMLMLCMLLGVIVALRVVDIRRLGA